MVVDRQESLKAVARIILIEEEVTIQHAELRICSWLKGAILLHVLEMSKLTLDSLDPLPHNLIAARHIYRCFAALRGETLLDSLNLMHMK